MTREFPDELLSAYIDGELVGEELTLVEGRLNDDHHLRSVVEDLRSVSRQVQMLPQLTAGEDFTSRVVQAAIAAKAASQPATVVTKAPAPVEIRSGGRSPAWNYVPWAALAGVAACIALMAIPRNEPGLIVPLQNNGGGNVAVEVTPKQADKLLAQLRQSVPGDDQVVVIRLRVPDLGAAKALDDALAAAGITQRPASDESTGAAKIGAEYRNKLAEKFGGVQPGSVNTALNEATIIAADALFVDAPWESLEGAISKLASDPEQMIELHPLMQIAAATQSTANAGEGEGEEPGVKTKGPTESAAAYAQRLNPNMFRLERAGGASTTDGQPQSSKVDGKRRVRVLILVEAAE